MSCSPYSATSHHLLPQAWLLAAQNPLHHIYAVSGDAAMLAPDEANTSSPVCLPRLVPSIAMRPAFTSFQSKQDLPVHAASESSARMWSVKQQQLKPLRSIAPSQMYASRSTNRCTKKRTPPKIKTALPSSTKVLYHITWPTPPNHLHTCCVPHARKHQLCDCHAVVNTALPSLWRRTQFFGTTGVSVSPPSVQAARS